MGYLGYILTPKANCNTRQIRISTVHANIRFLMFNFPAFIQPQMNVQIPHVMIPIIPCTAPTFWNCLINTRMKQINAASSTSIKRMSIVSRLQVELLTAKVGYSGALTKLGECPAEELPSPASGGNNSVLSRNCQETETTAVSQAGFEIRQHQTVTFDTL